MKSAGFMLLWRNQFVAILPQLGVAFVLVLAFTATYLRNAPLPWPWMEVIRAEIRGACEYPHGQWMTVGLVALYLFGFTSLRWLQVRSHADRFRIRTRIVLVAALAGWATVRYALNYGTAARSTDLLVLLTALAAGQSTAFLLDWEEFAGHQRSVTELKLKLLRLLAVLIVLGSLIHPAASREFQYRGNTRWVGLWENPNHFGVLMAVGLVLNLGLLNHAWRGLRYFGHESYRSVQWGVRCAVVVWSFGSLATGTGLIFSYSRGAWLGAVVGVGWLCWRKLHGATEPYPRFRLRLVLFRRCVPMLTLLALSLGAIGFWSLRHTEVPLLRRGFTVGNPNDFSWRNRVATWPGTLELMARKPLTGWGWNRPVTLYEQGIQPVWLSESGAITQNDYCILGITLGVPALSAFLLWTWLAWQPAASDSSSPLCSMCSPRINYNLSFLHAALLPLLVSFAVDAGLFKLAIVVPFCILTEIMSDSTRCIDSG